MKKIICTEKIDYPIDGKIVLHLSPKGCLATETQAKQVLRVFPTLIQIREVKDIKAEVKKELADLKVSEQSKEKESEVTDVNSK